MDEKESSFPGIGYNILEISESVSTIPIVGIRNEVASCNAQSLAAALLIKTTPGSAVKSKIPSREAFKFILNLFKGDILEALIKSLSANQIFLKFDRVPPIQRLTQKGSPQTSARGFTAPNNAVTLLINKTFLLAKITD